MAIQTLGTFPTTGFNWNIRNFTGDDFDRRQEQMDKACPLSCTQDWFRIYIRPGSFESDADEFTLTMTFEKVRRVMETSVTYSAPDLLADMGGHIGLLLGWSLLSLFSGAKELAGRACRLLGSWGLGRRLWGRRTVRPATENVGQ
ncbi:hypothetical protein FJT64_006489 [Amphibalanus amphitrite]|uniref:Uncharacterized protein n=1 Tax=Amphibalanus amphitrite TaxID=1232801 RepID=A0A6A4VN93_AMPAM|nr:hypothetical protein FJT64_006484 [Amphibalanus amphitrite]KAF0296026.1 hypothetical protein FJT64_006489 [Amphibalanus amphitrite]